jgi:zinc transporter ZupT
MTLFIIALAAFFATMAGGSLALKLRDRLHLILGFSAGAVILLLHNRAHDGHNHTESRGHARAGSLSLHSFLDGVGIGLAFQVNAAVGVVVAAAVLTHDFSDGINTVNVVTRHGGSYKKALYWLLVDAAAPVLGIVATLFFGVTDEHLGLLLALFAGFFLYIGASDLIPESHHAHPTFWTTFATIVGAAALYTAIRLAGV